MRPLLAAGLLGLALLAGAPAAAEPSEKERTEAFADYAESAASGQKARAADALVEMVQDPEREVFHGEAYDLLGDLLISLDLEYGALAAYKAALDAQAAGDQGLNPETARKALDAADVVGDQALLEPVFADNVGLEVDAETRSRLAWLAARENFRRDDLATALGILAMVGSDSPYFARAQLLKGIITSQQGAPEQALAPLLTAASLAAQSEDDALLTMVNLNLGRAYYAAQNYPRAIEYYAQVPRGSHWWPEAQFERAWAHFQLTDINGALALLHNHASPFFSGWYFPEGEMLRIYSLFLLCKFPTATEGIESFQSVWGPAHAANAPIVAGMDAAAVFADARSYAAGGDHRISETFLRDYPHEEAFLATVRAVEAAEAELTRLQGVSANPFSGPVSRWITERRDAMIAAEGERIKSRITSQLDFVIELVNSCDILLLDMTRMERLLYEQAAGTGAIAEAPTQVDRAARVRRGFVEWDYQGEFWGDELGYYRVDGKSECPAGLQTGR